MNNSEMTTVQDLLEKTAKGELVKFKSRFIIALSKHDAKYNLTLWEKGTLKNIAEEYGVIYTPNDIQAPSLTIIYTNKTYEIPKDAWGYELEDGFDVDSILHKAKIFADEVLMDKTKVPTRCWVMRNQAFFI